MAITKQREHSKGGGTIIFVRETIKFEVINSPYNEGILETSAIKLDNQLVITCLYRPPSGNKQQCIDELVTWIESLNHSKLIIAGDWNLNILNNSDKLYFDNLCNSTNLKTKIKSITRLASGTCIDNVVTDLDGSFRVSNICIADHQGISFEVKIETIVKNKTKYTYREMKECNWLLFKNEIKRIQTRGRENNEKWNNLLSDIKICVNMCFPEKNRTKEYKFTMSQGLLKSKHRKNKLLKQYKQGIIDKSVYIKYNKTYRKLIEKEKENSFKERLEDAGSDSKKKWKVLKKELKLQQTNDTIESINYADEVHTDPQIIANSFKSHFETCAKNLAENLPAAGDCEILIDQCEDFNFTTVSLKEIEKLIQGLQPKSSSGFDNLSNRMLKKERITFSRLLLPLINESLTLGNFPEALKIAKVIPIHKKGDKRNLNNYRPISLLPVLSKVFEKVLNNQLNARLEGMNIVDDNQYGFRSGHGTDDAITKFVDEIEKELTKNKHVCSIYIDVSKAFDSCDHSIMLKKLQKIGLTGTSLKIMESYLKDRTQEVWVGKQCGGRFKINIGVGQGTVLGPTLFKIYIIDMYRSTNLFNMRFADDTSLIGAGKNKEDTEDKINYELEKLYKWFCSNRLTLHPDKSRYIIHTKDKLINLKLGNKNIMRCGYNMQEEGVKLLGVIIDENLDWKLQTKHVTKKIGKGNYLLWRYKKQLTTNMKKTLYESFVRCHITYCNTVWGAKKSREKTDLIKLQKRIWRKIDGRKMHTEKRLKEHGILKFQDELRLAECKIIWRWDKNKIPKGLSNIITEKNRRQLRSRQFERKPKWKNDSLSFRLASRAMSEIEEITCAKSKNGLKNKYKKLILQTYDNDPCRTRNCYICSRSET